MATPLLLGGWTEFIAAFALFLASHSVPARPTVRRRIVSGMGERSYLILYSALSLAILAWLISAAGRAPYTPLWDFAPWQLWAPNIAMPFVCLLAAFGIGAANPLSVAGRRPGAFDPDHPGIAGVTRHPLLWAFALWAGAHIIPNGNAAHVALFGFFALFALLGMWAFDRRQQRRLGRDEWRRLAARTSFLPFAALVTGRWRPAPQRIDWRRLAIAVAVYFVLILGHPLVIGVSPLPML